ncbi:MAG TPA: YaiO family outer membrane beta-barrel protein [Candidatus Dormibacteraeota bacterium]|nr:YaiO family outer membrane beta-barrel protein [Candidatus Dormibacteraeota bacterium]
MKISHGRFRRNIALFVLAHFGFAMTTNGQQSATTVDPVQPSRQGTGTVVPTEPAPERILTNFVELGGSYEGLSNSFGHWSGGYLRGAVSKGKNTWNVEVNGQHEFGDAGVYIAAGDIYNFNSDWYAAVTLGSSAGGFFWPRFRADGFLSRKWAANKQFITTVGFGYDVAKDVHRDHKFFVGTVYYFKGPWIVEDGVHFNVSNPGRIFSASGFVAVTQGRNKQHYATLNVGFGQQAYQLIGPATALTRFPSQTASLTWRQWVGKNWGFNFVTDFFHSPFYHRGGGSFGFFKEF